MKKAFSLFLCLLIIMASFTTVFAASVDQCTFIENCFKDVDNNATYANAVLWAKAEGITAGTSATTFSPNATCTRGQVMTYLWISAGKPEPKSTNNPFSDVKASDYFYKPVLWAVEQGITAGTSPTTFGPNNTCTEAQILTFLWVANSTPEAPINGSPAASYPDGTYYKKPVAWAFNKGMIGSSYNALANCPRANVVKYLYVNSGSPTIVNTSVSLGKIGKGSITQYANVNSKVLVDANGIKITATGMRYDGWSGPELTLLIENNSGKDLTFQARDVTVNGYVVDDILSEDVTNGNKSNTSLTIMGSYITKCGINTISDITFSIHAFTTEGWDTYFDSQPLTVYTSAYGTYTQKYDTTGAVVYDNNGIIIVAKGIMEEDSVFGPGVVFYIENNSNKNVTVQTRDEAVNGYMVETICSMEIPAKKKTINSMTLMNSSLTGNGITSIERMEFSFHIFDGDTWDTIEDSNKKSFTFK